MHSLELSKRIALFAEFCRMYARHVLLRTHALATSAQHAIYRQYRQTQPQRTAHTQLGQVHTAQTQHRRSIDTARTQHRHNTDIAQTHNNRPRHSTNTAHTPHAATWHMLARIIQHNTLNAHIHIHTHHTHTHTHTYIHIRTHTHT